MGLDLDMMSYINGRLTKPRVFGNSTDRASARRTRLLQQYRPVSLLKAVMKTLTSVIYEDMEAEWRWYIPPSQCGGRRLRAARDAIFVVSSTIRRARHYGLRQRWADHGALAGTLPAPDRLATRAEVH